MLRNVAIRLAQQIFDEVPKFHMQVATPVKPICTYFTWNGFNSKPLNTFQFFCHPQNFFQASKYIPDISVIRAVQKIVWASGCGSIQLVFSPNEDISKIYEKVKVGEIQGNKTNFLPMFFNQFHNLNVCCVANVLSAGVFNLLTISRSWAVRCALTSGDLQNNAGNEPDMEDEQVCCVALETMTLCFALIPTALDTLSKEKAWQTFIIDLLLHCQSKLVPNIHTDTLHCYTTNVLKFSSWYYYCRIASWMLVSKCNIVFGIRAAFVPCTFDTFYHLMGKKTLQSIQYILHIFFISRSLLSQYCTL